MSLYCGHAECVLPTGHGGPHTDDGAPIGADVPMPQYTPKLIASCPTCGTDLNDEAFSWWCPACRRSVPFNEVAIFDEGQELD